MRLPRRSYHPHHNNVILRVSWSLPRGGTVSVALTDAGKAELQKEAETVKQIWRRAEQAGDWAPWMGMEGAEVMRPAAAVMKAALKAATRGSHDSARVAKIREILERTTREIEALEKV